MKCSVQLDSGELAICDGLSLGHVLGLAHEPGTPCAEGSCTIGVGGSLGSFGTLLLSETNRMHGTDTGPLLIVLGTITLSTT